MTDHEYITANAAQLAAEHPGKWALVAGGELVSVHDTEYSAVMDACHRYSPTRSKLFAPGQFVAHLCCAAGRDDAA